MAKTKKTAVKEGVEKKTASKPKKSSAGKQKSPQNMEELLASSGYQITVPKKGETLTGLVTAKGRKMVLVDIGAKMEGVVTGKEFVQAKEFIESLSVGDEVEVFVINEETDKGQILLSLRRAMMNRLWSMLEDYCQKGETVVVRGVETNRGGMIVKWQGLRGFVPTSQFGAKWAERMGELVGKKFKVKPIEVDKEKNRLIFSERHVSEADLLERREKALAKVKPGDVYKGEVTGLMSFGAFVKVKVPVEEGVGEVEGLVHISEISWEKVEDIGKYVKVGDEIEVKVLGIEEGTGKLNLSIKQLTDDPWADIEKKYAEGKKVKGVVSRVAPFGVFVHFEPGVDGLIHVSKLPAGKQMKKGDEVEVFVENLDPEHRRMSLALVLTEVPVGYK